MDVMIKHRAIDAVKTRLGYNIKRVENLLSLYDELAANKESNYANDILRSAVVLLHATLEDVLRGLLKWKKMRSNHKQLTDIQFYLDEKESKHITLSQLAAVEDKDFEDMTIRAFIKDTIKRHYDRESFSNRRQINYALEALGLTPSAYAVPLNNIEPMTTRRHLIVHQSDRCEPVEGKHGKLTEIAKEDVEKWRQAVRTFLDDILSALEPKPRKIKPMPVAQSQKRGARPRS
ncbi:MAG: HEPN domain-containing protein [Tepidisphaeraceae bacterium]|jgi:hypothetical protein